MPEQIDGMKELTFNVTIKVQVRADLPEEGLRVEGCELHLVRGEGMGKAYPQTRVRWTEFTSTFVRALPLSAWRASLPKGPEAWKILAEKMNTMPPDPLALDPEDGTLCADCKTPRNGYHGALCSVRAGAKPGRVPDPRATLHAGDPQKSGGNEQ